jgi:hypothetical protein
MLVAVLFATLAPTPAQSATPPAQFGVCEKEATTLFGISPVRIGKNVKAPKRIRYVAPKYPEWPAGTVGSGMWVGEFLIDTKGRVAKVWPIREPRFTPPFPQFNQAIVDAVKESLYEPLVIDGRARPVCGTMTVNINWS